VGSWMLATVTGLRTVTGMDCVMVVSLSNAFAAGAGAGAMESVSPGGASDGSRRGLFSLRPFSDEVMGLRAKGVARVVVRIVRERTGMSFFFVRRREAEEAVTAERRARFRWARETWRLMMLLAVADSMM
ncbi:MAG: hypothetical protein Q9212_004047, partial [Teloschistes hypoglaucus]